MKLTIYRLETGEVTAIAGEAGRVYTPMVWIDSPIRLHKVANADAARHSRELPKAPPLKRAANRMLKAGKNLGITKPAKQFLREAKRA